MGVAPGTGTARSPRRSKIKLRTPGRSARPTFNQRTYPSGKVVAFLSEGRAGAFSTDVGRRSYCSYARWGGERANTALSTFQRVTHKDPVFDAGG